ncbi:FHA domain-containing protein [Phormidium sp. CLA17]|uniref:FHA domain-containing protein n=1 Tax=Leptolyngbya sp. Cla-17 TaxID=2803751 RepID=UPI00149298F2|nr:FHA domain-containing protein [Leptolyngbya sp. Cla-17]MBM0740189.1 FHA domain-containing protein [Leptolyngbya sp. Cla-17]
MLDLNSLADFSPNSQSAAGHSTDLEQRLGLYQVFLKLYEHHRELLDEIIELENTDNRNRLRGVWQYVQAVINGDQVYLTTNLLQDQTQIVTQSENLWVIGRDRKASLPIPDKRLSRRHAIVQYVADKGFFLMDLDSTNGTFVNNEPVRRPVLLKDGDRIRLGSLSFIFFLCESSRCAEPIPLSVLSSVKLVSPILETRQLEESPAMGAIELSLKAKQSDWDAPLQGGEKETSMFLKPTTRQQNEAPEPKHPQLSPSQQADILDRFLNR